jgi:succinoglycan biosynthesis transport protein ExoP
VNATVADTLSNPIITQLRTRYLELVNREANWSRKYGADHLAVVNLRSQINDMRRSILEESKRLRETYLSNYEIARQQERDLEKRLADAISQSRTDNKAQVALRGLESSAQSLRTMHDIFLQRYTESLQQQSFPMSEVRIFSPASLLLISSNRKIAQILLMATAGGFAFGVAVGMFRELMNRALYTRDQVESELQTDCISIVPLVASDKKPAVSRSTNRMLSCDQDLGDFKSQRFIPRNSEVFWTVLDSPFSRFAEAIRSIKLAIDLKRGASNTGEVIGFTSSLPTEGKSTIASSVAILMAETGARVILVDCDLRNPTLSRRLTRSAEHGILDVIAGKVPLDDVVWTDRSTNLRFVPAGVQTHFMHSSEVLAANATKELFENLRSMYDYILVDMSPLMPIVDARATSGFVDCYVCVVEWGHTKIDAVKYAFKDAQNLSENLLGVVLNKVDINRLGSHYPVGENYLRNQYYTQYGFK